jgi:GntR family transcriptional regulator/MocR family aminotransferase
MQLPILLDGSNKATLQNQIFDQIRSMILEGQLKIGDPLPATRELSSQVGVSRNTAVLAYERLIAEGYVETRPHVGTYVAATCFAASGSVADSAETEPCRDARSHDRRPFSMAHPLADRNRRTPIADFRLDRADARIFPFKAWSRLVSKRLKTGGALAEYGDSAGLLELRRAIVDHLGPTRGVVADPAQVVVVGGRLEGLNLVARLLVRQGTPAVVEQPCCRNAASVWESFGARLHPAPVDHDGVVVTRLPRIEGGIAHVTPSHQYPLGVTLALQRRAALLSWAAEHRTYVVEDDCDSDFRYVGSPVIALKGLDRGDNVIYIGSFSKSMGPASRLGYVVLPRRLVDEGRRAAALMSDGRDWLEQAAMADFMTSGGFIRHLRRVRQLHRARRDALLGALREHFGACEILGDQSGTHLAWRLPDRIASASAVEAAALDAGVGVYTLASGAALQFEEREDSDRILLLGYASLTEREIERGVARLAAALSIDKRSDCIATAIDVSRKRNQRERAHEPAVRVGGR